jgi:hypothetical protein
LRSADRQDVENGFLLFLVTDEGQECIEPAESVAGLCAGLASN